MMTDAKAEPTTLKQARVILSEYERTIARQKQFLDQAYAERDKAREDLEKLQDKFDEVSERADVMDDYDTLSQLLADYKTYGWSDRLEEALRLMP